jgi:hypothetical protein
MPVDELQRLLLARLTGQEGVEGAASLPDLLERAMGDDPLAAPLAAALRSREVAQATASEEGRWEGDPDSALAVADPVVSDVLNRLYAEVQTLRERNSALADALGACARCWGEDLACRICRGKGQAGGRAPDPELFRSIVRPAMRRRQLDEARRDGR